MLYDRLISYQKIEKGWSSDQKFCVTDEAGQKYLLRISPKEKAAFRADMYRMQSEAAKLDIPICLPLEFGECKQGVYGTKLDRRC